MDHIVNVLISNDYSLIFSYQDNGAY